MGGRPALIEMFTQRPHPAGKIMPHETPLSSQAAHLPWAACHFWDRAKSPPPCARLPDVTTPPRRARIAAALCAALAMLLVAAPAALADNGVGLAGPTTDKTVTFFCFGVIAFFAITVIVLSLIQGRLEKRKEMRRSDLERYG